MENLQITKAMIAQRFKLDPSAVSHRAKKMGFNKDSLDSWHDLMSYYYDKYGEKEAVIGCEPHVIGDFSVSPGGSEGGSTAGREMYGLGRIRNVTEDEYRDLLKKQNE